MMTNSDPDGWIFFYPHTKPNNGFFFLFFCLQLKTPFGFTNKLSKVPEYAHDEITLMDQ